ncbi:hypothetical protein DYQ86_06950 [Acidobacteria bacterium AB60]|nr:hypothetical protein DYQ86_06950 [Acidobacteria bacterium AB60]
MTGSAWTDVLLFVVFITISSVIVFRLDTMMTSARSRPIQEPKTAPARERAGKVIMIPPPCRSARLRARK